MLMDAAHFDHLTLALTRVRSRRALVALLAGLGVPRGVARAFSVCLENGNRCGRPSDPECCSGRCVRKRNSHKRFCRPAPGQGTCTIDSDYCASSSLPCGSPKCACFRRPNGASVCADAATRCLSENNCTDDKCRKLLHNKKAFCAKSEVDDCCSGVSGVCVVLCPDPDLPAS